MKYIVETGCDGATLCFFDPAALPKDFDTRVQADSIALMEQLQTQQTLCFIETDGDGGYIFHLYIDENPPASFIEKATLEHNFNAFLIPSGKLCICGAEYAANDPLVGSQFTPKGGLSCYSQMGSLIELTAGQYQIELYSVEWSDEEWELAYENSVSKTTYQHYRRLQLTMIFSLFAGGLVLLFAIPFSLTLLYNYLFSTCTQSSVTLAIIGLLIGCTLFGLGCLLTRIHNRSEVTKSLAIVEKEMPDYLLLAKYR